MEGFCRGCLIKYDEPMELLQYTEKNRRLFVYSTGLQVKRNDTFIFQLCKDCFLNMKLACKFKKLCRTSDKRFKNYLAIKDIGDPIDFCTFLKNSDDTLTFRLPMTSGNSTPANQKCRDDDNESTCTSIRNFMTDMLQGEEMPDTEASIIREVIEEEADVLEDSLDSHWMQDDISIDTDFRLDFNNFSPFSTPRSVNNDHRFTPKKYVNQNEERMNFSALNSKEENKNLNNFKNAFKNDQNIKELCHFGVDDIDGVEKSESDALKNDQNIKKICIFGVDPIDGIEKRINNIDMPSLDDIGIDKSVSNLDLPSLDSVGVDKSVSNIDMPLLDDFGIDKSISHIDMPSLDSIGVDKSMCNNDLPSLDGIGVDKSMSNFDMPSLDGVGVDKSMSIKNLPSLDRIGVDKSVTNINFASLGGIGVNKSMSNFDKPSLDGIGVDKSMNNDDLPSLDSIGVDKTLSNIEMPSLDGFGVDKSMSNNDLPSLDDSGVDKSLSNIDLPSLDSFGIDKSINNIDVHPLEDLDKDHISTQNVYIPKDDIKTQQCCNEINNDSIDIDALLKDKPCTIDRNLEKALKNEDSKEFSLDELLVSPPVFQGESAASTPTIRNILFGEKLELPDKNITSKIGQYTETFEDAQGDIEIFEEFFQNDTKEFDIEDIKKVNVVINKGDAKQTVDVNGKESMNMDVSISKQGQLENDMEREKKISSTIEKKLKYKEEIDITTGTHDDKFDLIKFYCYLCNKKFKDVKALSIHFAKYHRIKIVKPKIKYNKSKLCNVCGEVSVQMTNFNRHLKNCRKKPEVFKCERCPVECTSEAKLKMHMGTHRVNYPKKDTEQKYVCTICGAVISKRGNYNLHLRRHTNNFTTTCKECGKGFYRMSDLKTHMRQHTGETPYKCAFCDWSFARRDVLNRHIKLHMGEKLYQCEHCDSKYVTKSDLKRHINTKICLKKLGLLPEPTNITTDTQPEEQVTVIYTTGNQESIRSQLPLLETEMSN